MNRYKKIDEKELLNISGGGNFMDYMVSYWKGLWKGLTS